jgi:hypothetical protein
MDFNGLETRVCGRGRNGELRSGVHCWVIGAVVGGAVQGGISKLTRLVRFDEVRLALMSDEGELSGV